MNYSLVNPQSLSIAPAQMLGVPPAPGVSPPDMSSGAGNILQMLSQLFGSGGLGQFQTRSPMNSAPTASTPTASTIPQWIQSQLSTAPNAGTPQQQMATLYPSYTPDQTNLALGGQLYGTLGSNNLPWTQ